MNDENQEYLVLQGSVGFDFLQPGSKQTAYSDTWSHYLLFP